MDYQQKLELVKPKKKKKRQRRKKKDLGNLDFVCGCGKAYTCYPALFTHIKRKHGGQEPEGTIRSRNQRGRPKVLLQQFFSFKQQQKQKIIEIDNNPLKQPFSEEFIQEMRSVKHLSQNTMFFDDDFKYSGIKEFPHNVFKIMNDYFPILENIKFSSVVNEPQFEKHDLFNSIRDVKLNTIFGIFLNSFSKTFPKTIYKEYCILLIYYRKTLNKIGYTMSNQSLTELYNPEEEYCEFNNGNFAADAANYFILKDFPRMLAEMKSQYQFYYLSASEQGIMNCAIMIRLFCNWLHYQFFSNTSILQAPDY